MLHFVAKWSDCYGRLATPDIGYVLWPMPCLRGLSTGDFEEALGALLGKDAPSLSPVERDGLDHGSSPRMTAKGLKSTGNGSSSDRRHARKRNASKQGRPLGPG